MPLFRGKKKIPYGVLGDFPAGCLTISPAAGSEIFEGERTAYTITIKDTNGNLIVGQPVTVIPEHFVSPPCGFLCETSEGIPFALLTLTENTDANGQVSAYLLPRVDTGSWHITVTSVLYESVIHYSVIGGGS